MTGPDRLPFPAPLLRFVDLFNREEFWESHEVLEGPWRERNSGFYQGLILYASAFVHVKRDNPHGIVAQLEKAERRLKPFEPMYLGVDVTGLRAHARDLRQRVDRRGEEDREALSGTWEEEVSYPRLRLARDRIRGDEPELEARRKTPEDPP